MAGSQDAAADGDHADTPVVIRISPMAHIAPVFMVAGLIMFFPLFGRWSVGLLVVPILLSVAIERFRTVADRERVTARTLTASRSVPWSHIEGLRFSRGGWARARCNYESEILLPAVTFATLPALTKASGGRVPNPFQR
jgi:hypothetical protein